ncbi:hypothetical protein D3P08_06690 [Paenibacillus nanensis]|uniref:Tetratricopeptide repeat protein n=1 Tax=Paenibacillus nanensis TaxID=393251 RepID=A0A3A1UZM7_9BACL|nr:hypothetical protein [Paenibacillus nanensis]RIX53938.1 hypothetical protein D3P08_06690 [Paenibacillus nanensis]
MLNLVNASASSDSFGQRLEQAVSLHMKGVDGDAAAVLQAIQMLEALRADYPGNPLVEAYYGSSLVLIARDKTKPLEQLRWSNQGLKILDSAVAASPNDLTVRLLRGKNAYQLPEHHFQRTQTTIEDYTYIVGQHMRGNTILTQEEYSQLLYELGDAYARIGRNQEAASIWQRLEAPANSPEMQQLARQRLQSLEGKPAQETINQNSPLSALIEMTRAIGGALVSWSDDGKARGKKDKMSKKEQKEREKERKKEREKNRKRELTQAQRKKKEKVAAQKRKKIKVKTKTNGNE